MTKIKSVVATPHWQTEAEYCAELDNKPIAEFSRDDLIFLAEELHWAKEFSQLAPYDGDSAAASINRVCNLEGLFEEIEEVFGEAAVQDVYDEVARNHAGDIPIAYMK